MFEQLQCGPLARRGAVLAALTLLSLLAGFSQIKTEGLGWQEAHYLPRLEAVVSGTAPAPWQYRTLTDRLVLAACQQAQDLRVPRPVGSTFVALRLLQNFLLFLAAHAFYRRLGIGAYASVLGLSALAWGMTQANYGSDLAFDAYTDILLYLCAAIALLEKRFRLLVPIAVVAAFNRETSGLLPVMLMAVALVHRSGNGVDRDLLGRGAIALGLFVAIQLGLRLLRGPSDWVEHPSGATPDFGFLAYNLQNDAAWGHSVGVLGIVPVLALVTYRGWHPVLRPLFWSVVPAWILLHLLCAPLDQARVLLLPQVLVFIPAMLCGIRHAHAQQDAGRGVLA